MSTVSQESQPDWNQGWQDLVIGLALSFALVEAISFAILLQNRPAPAVAPVAAASMLTLVATILSLAMPPVLGYGMYAALATWTYRAQARLLAVDRSGGDVYGRAVRSPYRLGSVLIFWATLLGLVASSVFGRAGSTHTVEVTATALRLSIGIACAWLAVFVRRDIDEMVGRGQSETADNSRAVEEPAP